MTSPGRYYLLLAAAERPVQHGWWESEDVARDKFRGWVDQYGGAMPAVRVTLSDDDCGAVLDAWPDQR
jgi:hypothetical protein